MKRNTIRITIILGLISITGIIIFQVYLLRKNFSLKERELNQSIQIALTSVAEILSEYNNTVLPYENVVYQYSSNYYLVNVNDVIDAESSADLTVVTTAKVNDDSLTAGQTANAELTFSIPADITSTNYFYQIYRTAPVTTSVGVTLEDIDPGDEMNLTLESNLTAAEISAGQVVVEDLITEQFRASGAFL